MDIETILAQMSEIVETAKTESRSLSDEEVTRYEGLEKDLNAARKTDEIRSRQGAYEAPSNISVVTAAPKGDAALEFAFNQYLRTGQRNMDLVELRAQGTSPDSAGGYLVPEGFRAKLVERMVAYGGILNAVENITTSSGAAINWPTVDDTANNGEIVAEHATGTNGADIVFGTASLGAYKYMSLGAGDLPLRVSVELLQDSAFDIESLLARLLGKRIRRAMAIDAVTGDGSGEPLGIAFGTPDHNLASTTAITYAELLAIVHSVDPDYRENASWAFNDATLATIRGLLDGNDRPLLTSGNEGIASARGGGTLLGYPVVIDQAFGSATGDNATFAVFGDLKEAYIWRNVRDVQLVVDPFGRAANGEVQFTAWARADGTVQNANAYVKVATQNVP